MSRLRPSLKRLQCSAETPSRKSRADRLVRKKLWGQRHGAIGKAQTVEDHAGDGFPGRDILLVIEPKACVDHLNEAQVLDDARNDS